MHKAAPSLSNHPCSNKHEVVSIAAAVPCCSALIVTVSLVFLICVRLCTLLPVTLLLGHRDFPNQDDNGYFCSLLFYTCFISERYPESELMKKGSFHFLVKKPGLPTCPGDFGPLLFTGTLQLFSCFHRFSKGGSGGWLAHFFCSHCFVCTHPRPPLCV